MLKVSHSTGTGQMGHLGQVGHPGTLYPLIMPNDNKIPLSGMKFFQISEKKKNRKNKRVK